MQVVVVVVVVVVVGLLSQKEHIITNSSGMYGVKNMMILFHLQDSFLDCKWAI